MQLVTSAIRNNLSYVFFSDLGEIAMKSIYESIHIKMSFRQFNDYVNENNHDFQFILYDGMTTAMDRIKIVKAKQYDNMKMLK